MNIKIKIAQGGFDHFENVKAYGFDPRHPMIWVFVGGTKAFHYHLHEGDYCQKFCFECFCDVEFYNIEHISVDGETPAEWEDFLCHIRAKIREVELMEEEE